MTRFITHRTWNVMLTRVTDDMQRRLQVGHLSGTISRSDVRFSSVTMADLVVHCPSLWSAPSDISNSSGTSCTVGWLPSSSTQCSSSWLKRPKCTVHCKITQKPRNRQDEQIHYRISPVSSVTYLVCMMHFCRYFLSNHKYCPLLITIFGFLGLAGGTVNLRQYSPFIIQKTWCIYNSPNHSSVTDTPGGG